MLAIELERELELGPELEKNSGKPRGSRSTEQTHGRFPNFPNGYSISHNKLSSRESCQSPINFIIT